MSLGLIFIQIKGYLFSKVIKSKSIIILIDGAHGFKVSKNIEMIEVKQGPFIKQIDKKIPSIDEKKSNTNKKFYQ